VDECKPLARGPERLALVVHVPAPPAGARGYLHSDGRCQAARGGDARWTTRRGHHDGRSVQVDPITLTLKVPGTKRLKLKYYRLLANFTFVFHLRRYMMAACKRLVALLAGYSKLFPLGRPRYHLALGRGLHSFTFKLNLSRFSHTSPCPSV